MNNASCVKNTQKSKLFNIHLIGSKYSYYHNYVFKTPLADLSGNYSNIAKQFVRVRTYSVKIKICLKFILLSNYGKVNLNYQHGVAGKL